jgi:hypothetical protein
VPTFFQQLYNDQNTNVLDVTGPVLYIDAPSVERWLDEHDSPRHLDDWDDRDWPRFHSDSDDGDDDGEGRESRLDRGYTIYFVNWYNRSDAARHWRLVRPPGLCRRQLDGRHANVRFRV